MFQDAPDNPQATCVVACEAHICDGQNGSPPPGSFMFPELILADIDNQGNIGPIDADVVGVVENDQSKFNGRTLIEIAGATSGQGAPLRDLMIIQIVKPEVGDFPTNQAINFETNPDAAVPTGATAQAFFFGDVDMQGNIVQLLWASSGSVTLTEAGEQEGDLITGNVAATNFRQVDLSTGADVPAGCTVSLAGLEFHMRQMAAMNITSSKQSLGGAFRPLTSDEWSLVRRTLRQLGR